MIAKFYGAAALPMGIDTRSADAFANLRYLGIHFHIQSSDIPKSFTLSSLQTLMIVNASAFAILLPNIVIPVLNHSILKDIEIHSFSTIPLVIYQLTFPSLTF